MVMMSERAQDVSPTPPAGPSTIPTPTGQARAGTVRIAAFSG